MTVHDDHPSVVSARPPLGCAALARRWNHAKEQKGSVIDNG